MREAHRRYLADDARLARQARRVPRGASGRKLLDHAGTISAEVAKAKAEREYDRYQRLQDTNPRAFDAAFEVTAKQLKKPAPIRAKTRRGKS
ncbi:MAG: hypothetical protein KF850_26935 [Labilithrix sp.]|nr:hypothetical protein [Labilithrix sp.]